MAKKQCGGGQPTERWQDKSREVRGGRSAGKRAMIKDLAQCAPAHESLPNSRQVIVMQSRSAPRARNVMTRDDDLHIRLGRIRSRGSRSRPFIAQALAAAEKAGGLARPSRSSTSWQVRTWPGRESLCLTPDRSLTSSGGKGPRGAAPGEPGSAQCSSELPAARGRNQRRGRRSHVRCRAG